MTAAAHLLDRIARDPRLAYYFDPLTRSMEILTAEYASQKGLDLEEFRRTYYEQLKFESPKSCSESPKGEAESRDTNRLNRLQELLNAGDVDITHGTDIRRRLDQSGAQMPTLGATE